MSINDVRKKFVVDKILEKDKVEKINNIVNIELRFGKVRVGFWEVESTVLYCDMLENLDNGFVFTNYTKVFG